MPGTHPSTATLPRCAPPAAEPRCHGCGRTAEQIADARPGRRRAGAFEEAEGDLACIWLIPQRSRWTEARFCHGCAPVQDRWPIDCAICRDGTGPILLLGELRPQPALPGMPADPRARDMAQEYLRHHGWRKTGHGLACPACADGC